RARISSVTWIGLLIALFAMLVIRQTVSHFWPATTFTGALWKESLIWVSAVVLLILVRRGERLPFIDMVEIGPVGICHGDRVRGRGWRARGTHRLRTWPGLIAIRKTSPLVNHVDRRPRGRSRRIILSRICHRTPASSRAQPLRCGRN